MRHFYVLIIITNFTFLVYSLLCSGIAGGQSEELHCKNQLIDDLGRLVVKEVTKLKLTKNGEG